MCCTDTVPDLLVTGPDSRWQGWGGLRAAAHLTADWTTAPELTWP